MKMTLRDALEILVMAAERDLTGAGVGIRTIPTGEQRERIKQSIKRAQDYMWNDRRVKT